MDIQDNPRLLREFIDKVRPSLPTTELEQKAEQQGAHAAAKLRTSSEYTAAAALEQVFLLGQFLRATGQNTDELGYFTEARAQAVGEYAKLGLAQGPADGRLLFEKQVQAPAEQALKELFSRGR